MVKPTRPVLRYHGGKWRLAPWIISHFPAHRIYVEPFGGGGAVLVRKSRASIEVYNDLDETVVGVFRVLRDETAAAELERRLQLTPYARAEWEASFEISEDPIEHARRTIVRAFMGHGTKGAVSPQRTGFHTALSDRGRYTRVTSWLRMPDAIREFTLRLRGVLIECVDAVEVMQRFDAPDALHYLDPPYLGHGAHYRQAFTEEDHGRLAEAARSVQGMVVVSGYPNDTLDELYAGWKRFQKGHTAFGAAKRTEVLWISPTAQRLELFA